MNIYLDCETIPLPLGERMHLRPSEADIKTGNFKDESKIKAKIAEVMSAWERGEDAALDPLQGRVALIGYAVDNDPVKFFEDDDETVNLRNLWHLVAPRGYDVEANFVGHNIRFDAGMLVVRSWVRGVKVPVNLLADLYQFQPRHWLDTMTRFQLGDRRADFKKLKHLCAAFGIEVKDSPVKGSDFAAWWAKDRAACLEYNRQDVEAVRQLWRRIGAP
jgi:hypothetical protein